MKQIEESLSQKNTIEFENASQVIERPGSQGRQLIALNCQISGQMIRCYEVEDDI